MKSHSYPHHLRPLPHQNKRPPWALVDTIVIHSMCAPESSTPHCPTACIELLDREKVSSHYLIDQDGVRFDLVPEDLRAWHAGESAMPEALGGTHGVNDFSIGIELIAEPTDLFTELQYQSLAELIAEIATRHPILNVLGHEHIALPKGRKVDPGPLFDWKLLKKLLGQLSDKHQAITIP